MELIKSNRGGPKLCYEGFMYNQHKASKSSIRWNCCKRSSMKCPGTAMTNADATGGFRIIHQHNHGSDVNSVKIAKMKVLMKETAQRSTLNPSTIYAAAVASLEEEGVLLPDKESCKRALRYQRSKAQPWGAKEYPLLSENNSNSNIKIEPLTLDTGTLSAEFHDFKGIRATIIHPATEKHVQKYTYQPLFMVNETPEIYKDIVLPYLESQQFSMQWVYNILEHKSEQDRIIFEDPDPETGFVLIPDMKWDESQLDNPYVIAICHARGLKSLRDLTAEHIPLLKNIKEKSSEAILKKFKKPLSRFRVYFHYQPSYYHLHVHFSTFESDAPGTQAERAHLLDTVISNLELMSDYYKKATLTYAVKSSDPLFEKLKESGVI